MDKITPQLEQLRRYFGLIICYVGGVGVEKTRRLC